MVKTTMKKVKVGEKKENLHAEKNKKNKKSFLSHNSSKFCFQRQNTMSITRARSSHKLNKQFQYCYLPDNDRGIANWIDICHRAVFLGIKLP